MKAAEQRLAMLEQSSAPSPQARPARNVEPGPFDGNWRVSLTRNRHCSDKTTLTNTWEIKGNVIYAPRGGRAQVAADGQIELRWPNRNRPSISQLMKARLTADGGKGTWISNLEKLKGCGGEVTWTRENK
jgi:hypothetical protein